MSSSVIHGTEGGPDTRLSSAGTGKSSAGITVILLCPREADMLILPKNEEATVTAASIRLHPEDSVAIVLQDLEMGTTLPDHELKLVTAVKRGGADDGELFGHVGQAGGRGGVARPAVPNP